jgi:murein L,D-transpeptidase YcbB/YkuD
LGRALIDHRRRSLLLASALATAALARAQLAPTLFDVAQARSALALLVDAVSHGLDPRDYGGAALQRELDASAAVGPTLDRALGAALQRYLHDLRLGRVGPARLEPQFSSAAAAPAPFDAAATLRAALAHNDLSLAVRAAVPPLAQYERVREALARYRALAAHAAWQDALPALPAGRALEAGSAWSGVPLLLQRLVALGDAAADSVVPPRYEGPLVDAVRAFQQRHGLKDDGVIGRATWAALQVAPAQRARQLELALERLRWTPLLAAPRMVVVNIPEFVLRAYEVQGDRIAVALESRVIVGQAMDTRTPLIGELMRRVEFNPYWNVPDSIARKELVPRLRRDPSYAQREGFEFVGSAGVAGHGADGATLQAVLDGRLRIRQRPGPRNALGTVKFVFPNRESIYLHDTPSRQLFEQARRDFSHGCIRVEQPLALARFVLRDQPEGQEAHLRDALADARASSTVTLAQPLPVLIAYGTALVKQGRVHFFDDLYGHDRTLDAALRALSRPPITVNPPLS